MKRIFISMLAAAFAVMTVSLAGCGNAATTTAEVSSVAEVESESQAESSEAVSEVSTQDEITDEVPADPEAAMEELEEIPDEYAPLAQPAEGGYDVTSRMGRYIKASNDIRSSGGSQIDVGNASYGYVRVAQSGSSSRLKVQVIKGDKT
mgnify:FL=1